MTSTPPSADPSTGPDSPSDSTTPPGPPPAYPPYQPAGPRVTADQVRDLSRLRRITVDRKVAGVAGGIARHLDIDPVIVRVAFVVLTLFGGAGLIMYAACWILLPEDGQVHPPLGLDERSRSVALVLVGILGLALLVGQWDWFWVPGPLILIALVVWLFMSRRNDNAAAGTAVPPPGVPGAGPDAVTPEQRWGTPAATDAPPTYPAAPTDVPLEQQLPAYAAYQQSYQAGYQTGYQPPAPPPAATTYVQPVPRNPRKRGPILFWFTLALAALAVGVVGIVDVSGASVADSTYPAVVVAVVGFMLLVGAFYGRAGGLILVGLLAAGATAATVASEKWDGDQVEIVPNTSAEVQDSYVNDVGQYVLDLTQVTDPQELDGRTISMQADVGELDVVVPDNMDVNVTGNVDGPGGITLFGHDSGGIDVTASRSYDGGNDVPEITLDLQLDVGHIDVHTR